MYNKNTCYHSIKGDVAYRDSGDGSPFIQELTSKLEESACNNDVESIIKKVS